MTTTFWPSLHPCLLGMRISAYNGSAPSTNTVTRSWLSLLYTGRRMSLTLPMSLRLAGLITHLQLPFFPFAVKKLLVALKHCELVAVDLEPELWPKDRGLSSRKSSSHSMPNHRTIAHGHHLTFRGSLRLCLSPTCVYDSC